MRIAIDLPEEILKAIAKNGVDNNLSRKANCERILVEYVKNLKTA